MQAGIDRLLHGRTHPSRIPPLAPDTMERVVGVTQSNPLGETIHSAVAAIAAQVGLSVSSA